MRRRAPRGPRLQPPAHDRLEFGQVEGLQEIRIRPRGERRGGERASLQRHGREDQRPRGARAQRLEEEDVAPPPAGERREHDVGRRLREARGGLERVGDGGRPRPRGPSSARTAAVRIGAARQDDQRARGRRSRGARSSTARHPRGAGGRCHPGIRRARTAAFVPRSRSVGRGVPVESAPLPETPVRILLADDERAIAITLRDDLERAGHKVTLAKDGDEARAQLAEHAFDVLVTDIRMPGASGIELLQEVKRTRPETEVVIVTGYGTIESAVDATKKGAFEYVLKPFDNDQILVTLRKIEEFRRLRQENAELRQTLGREKALENVVGKSPAMLRVSERVRAVAESDANVLITGESGTGKERIARAIHDLSKRRDGPFVALACAAIPGPLLEDEIFGHERGAFTDAKERKGQWYVGRPLLVTENDYGLRPLQRRHRRRRRHRAGPRERRLRAARRGHRVQPVAAGRGRQRLRDDRPQEPGLAVRRRRRPAARPELAHPHARAALHRGHARARAPDPRGDRGGGSVAVSRPVARASGLRWRLWGSEGPA